MEPDPDQTYCTMTGDRYLNPILQWDEIDKFSLLNCAFVESSMIAKKMTWLCQKWVELELTQLSIGGLVWDLCILVVLFFWGCPKTLHYHFFVVPFAVGVSLRLFIPYALFWFPSVGLAHNSSFSMHSCGPFPVWVAPRPFILHTMKWFFYRNVAPLTFPKAFACLVLGVKVSMLW